MMSEARFELPSSGVCKACSCLVLKGTSLVAIKERIKVASHEKIQFTSACPHCGIKFVIQTNPTRRGFDYVEGLSKHSRKRLREVASLSMRNRTTVTTSGGFRDEPGVAYLEELKAKKKVFGNDAELNAKIRASFRKDRKQEKRRQNDPKSRYHAKGMILSEGIVFGDGNKLERRKFQQVRASSIFQSKSRPRKERLLQRQAATNTLLNDMQEQPDSIASIYPEDAVSGTAVSQIEPEAVSSFFDRKQLQEQDSRVKTEETRVASSFNKRKTARRSGSKKRTFAVPQLNSTAVDSISNRSNKGS